MTDKQSKLPEEVEGLVEMVARKFYDIWATQEIDRASWVQTSEHTKKMWRVEATLFLTRIKEHLGGRVVILSKDQTLDEDNELSLIGEAELSCAYPEVFDGSLDFGEYGRKKREYLKLAQKQLERDKEDLQEILATRCCVSCALDGTPVEG